MLDDQQPAKRRIANKIRKCLDLAADERGDPTTRATARRQAAALMARHGIQLSAAGEERPAAQPPIPSPSSAEWRPYWAQRTSAEAAQAGVKSMVLCRDGWYVPG
jgi:hypothetical protein